MSSCKMVKMFRMSLSRQLFSTTLSGTGCVYVVAGGNGKKPSMGGNGCTTRASSDSRSPISPKEKSLSTWETADSSLASGLSESQFLQWLSWLIVRSSTLNRISTKNFGPSMISSARSREVRSAENDKLNSVNSAGAMALLQWVELSRGARKNCIPSFQLSSSLL